MPEAAAPPAAHPAPPEPPGAGGPAAPPPPYHRFQWIGLVAGPLVLLAFLLAPPPAGLDAAGWRTAGVGLLMAVWWMTEAAPIPVTALLPIVLFPLLGVRGVGPAAAPYANPLIFLFMGGFMIALAMQRWMLHKRIALNILRVNGNRPTSLIAGFLTSTALLSLWVSNTATAMLMLPIAGSIVDLVHPRHEATGGRSNFAVVLMLVIAYGSSIGGMGTVIGTPTNALLVGFMSETYGVELGFVRWMLLAMPLVVVSLPLTFWLLTRVVYPIRLQEIPGGRDFIEREIRALGPVGRGERLVAFVFGLTALLWIFSPLIEPLLPGLSDAGIALFGALLLFLLPVDFRRGDFVLDWSWAVRLPWGVLLLFGGGLSLAAAINDTGLAAWIGGALGGAAGWPLILVILLLTGLITMLTELTSNTATAAAFLPIVASIAVGIGQDPLLLVIPTALAASCAFMLPVATPPNAIVYGSSFLTVPQMARAGIFVNTLFVLLITLLAYFLLPLVLDVQLGVVPEWAR